MQFTISTARSKFFSYKGEDYYTDYDLALEAEICSK